MDNTMARSEDVHCIGSVDTGNSAHGFRETYSFCHFAVRVSC